MLTIGREGKRQRFETETQEVLNTYSNGGKGETENQEVLSTYMKREKGAGI